MEIDVIRKIKNISEDENHRFNFIAKYIMQNIVSIPEITITQLAKATYSSPSTINRFTKFLELSGYKELIHIIKYFNYTIAEPSKKNQINSQENNFYYSYYNQVLQEIEQTFSFFSSQENIVTEVVEKIKDAQWINVFAMGGTFFFAKDFQETLLRLGFNIFAANNFHKGHVLVNQEKEKLLNIFISYSGETQGLIDLAKICKNNNSSIIVISKNNNNSLSRIADLNLNISSNDPINRVDSITNRLPLMLYLDIIFYKILFTNFEYYQKRLEKSTVKKI